MEKKIQQLQNLIDYNEVVDLLVHFVDTVREEVCKKCHGVCSW